MSEEELKLYELLKTSPSLFLIKCTEKFQNGEHSELCTYVQLKMLKDIGRSMDNVEREVLNNLTPKYGHIDTSNLLSEYERSIRIPSLDNVWQELKNVLRDIRLSVRNAHEKNPEDGYSGFLGFLNELWKNINGSKNFKYDSESFKELSDYYFKFKTEKYLLNENISIILNPGILLHILVGHVKKYHISRKGDGIMFSNVKNPEELMELIKEVIHCISDEIIEHYTKFEQDQDYNNTCIKLDSYVYGIHIDKKRRIKTFYEKARNANPL